MRKTTVYLNDEEFESLRQRAAASGRSHADLIREAIRRMASSAPSRRFRSLAKGEGTANPTNGWSPTVIHAKLFPASTGDSAPTVRANLS